MNGLVVLEWNHVFVFNREWTRMDANFFGGYGFIRVHSRQFVVSNLFSGRH